MLRIIVLSLLSLNIGGAPQVYADDSLSWAERLQAQSKDHIEKHAATINALQEASTQSLKDFASSCPSQSATCPIQPLQGDAFEEILKAAKTRIQNSFESSQQSEFYAFVSLSMPKEALLRLGHEAARSGAILVIRGLKEGSFKKTAYALEEFIQKTGQGLIVDPLLFERFNVQAVPTFVLAASVLSDEIAQRKQGVQKEHKDNLQLDASYDKLSGNVTLVYALEEISRHGDLKDSAKAILQQMDGKK